MYIREQMKYDGSLLHQRFSYRYFKNSCSPLGNLLAFRGPMEVLADFMIDQEDAMNKAFIDSEDAINFLWEIPLLGNNPFGAVAYQRLFNSQIAAILSQPEFLEKKISMRGDDIMVHYQDQQQEKLGKCSVSITHVKDHAALGHTGINIIAGKKAPAFAYSTHLNQQQVDNLIGEVMQLFNQLNQDIFIATAKTLTK